MATLENQGILMPSALTPYVTSDTEWFIQQYFVNQYPIISRVRRRSVGSISFKVRHTKYRPRTYLFGSALNNTDTYSVLTLANQTNRQSNLGDSSTLMLGDVIQIDSERVEVMGTPGMDPGSIPGVPSGQSVPAAGTVLIRRGAEATTVATHTSGTTAQFQGNSRSGGEVNQNGIAANPIEQDQFVQNYEFPVQVSGSAESMRAFGQQPGSPFDNIKAQQLDNMMRDMEHTSVYGIGEGLSTTNIRQKQIGISNQIVTNRITAPTNASAYLPQNFEQDVLRPLFNVGSAPNLLFCSGDFLAALGQWSTQAMRIDVGKNEYGIDVATYTSNLAPGLAIIPCVTMNPGELFCCMEEQLYWAVKRAEEFLMRGGRGDAKEGDWIAEGAIEVRDEEKAVYLSGITGYGTP